MIIMNRCGLGVVYTSVDEVFGNFTLITTVLQGYHFKSKKVSLGIQFCNIAIFFVYGFREIKYLCSVYFEMLISRKSVFNVVKNLK